MVKALHRALADFKGSKEKIRPLLIKHTKIKPDHFDFVYQKNLEVLSADGSLTEEDVTASYDEARKGAVNPPPVRLSDLYDLSILREVQAK